MQKQEREIQSLKKKLKTGVISQIEFKFTLVDIKLNWIVRDWLQLVRKTNYVQSKKFEVDGTVW